jgi:Fic family protein
MSRVTGRYERARIAGEEMASFIPFPLPPKRPSFVIDRDTRDMFQTAVAALGRLELAGAMVPSVDWFIYGFVRKEAVLSSQIEGTQATLVDLLTFEALAETAFPTTDVG